MAADTVRAAGLCRFWRSRVRAGRAQVGAMPKPDLPNAPAIERRTICAKIELRAEDKDDPSSKPASVRGYAALFESRSEDLGYWGPAYEVIERGAFEGCDMSDVVALFNHDESQPLARTGAGLTLGVDDTGLFYEFPLIDTTLSRDLRCLFERGIISQSSFAFTVSEDKGAQSFEEYRDEEGRPAIERRIKKIAKLYDVSPVTRPAYTDTSVALRCLQSTRARTLAPPPVPAALPDKEPALPAPASHLPPLTAAQRARLGLPTR